MKKLVMIWIISLFTLNMPAQDSTDKVRKLFFNGYVKGLQSGTINGGFIPGSLIHNRLNLKWRPADWFTGAVELRNRILWGREVERIPDYASLLRNTQEAVNLQKAWVDNGSFILHTNVERLYLDIHRPAWGVRLGRQRINWGVSTTWNPNDLFNTYSFLDFDYEERPGVDGGKFQYVFNGRTNLELAYAHTGSADGNIAAARVTWNKWNYDMHLIAGRYRDHATLGTGWAGYIGGAGFKGEVQYFFRSQDAADKMNLALEGDYMFKKGWYANMSMLFCSNGLNRPVNKWDSINLVLSPENLMPTRWNLILSAAKEFTPLFSGNISLLYAPGTNLLILLPSFQYSLVTNIDISLVWQSYLAEMAKRFQAVQHRGFIRLKWSF